MPKTVSRQVVRWRGMIRPHERAVAVAVDDVIGAAGQLRPGDYVDVLLFLREENNNPQSSAQVVLPALRVLSVGEQMGWPMMAGRHRPRRSRRPVAINRVARPAPWHWPCLKRWPAD